MPPFLKPVESAPPDSANGDTSKADESDVERAESAKGVRDCAEGDGKKREMIGRADQVYYHQLRLYHLNAS